MILILWVHIITPNYQNSQPLIFEHLQQDLPLVAHLHRFNFQLLQRWHQFGPLQCSIHGGDVVLHQEGNHIHGDGKQLVWPIEVLHQVVDLIEQTSTLHKLHKGLSVLLIPPNTPFSQQRTNQSSKIFQKPHHSILFIFLHNFELLCKCKVVILINERNLSGVECNQHVSDLKKQSFYFRWAVFKTKLEVFHDLVVL